MALNEKLLRIIESSDMIWYIIAILVFLCLSFGFLIIRKFYDIWQAEVEKSKVYRELIRQYENELNSGDVDIETSAD
ncbi:MAG: hypothetical protein HQ517_17945 [SAR324 cluster bacterium]|nr:hypothetical protein [SAR324 cluster bacterium]